MPFFDFSDVFAGMCLNDDAHFKDVPLLPSVLIILASRFLVGPPETTNQRLSIRLVQAFLEVSRLAFLLTVSRNEKKGLDFHDNSIVTFVRISAYTSQSRVSHSVRMRENGAEVCSKQSSFERSF